MNIQWYPGHMTKALRQIKDDIKLIDLIIEICDARIPVSSRNPEIRQLTNGKLHLLVLNKADLAEENATADWIRSFRSQGIAAVSLDSRSRASVRAVSAQIETVTDEKRERDLRRGIKNRPVRALVCGIPNAGKSTLTNTISGRKSAKTGDRPGVTKGKQWIHVSRTLDLLDSPGILWPKFDDEATGEALALFGAISDTVFQKEELALILYHRMRELYPGRIASLYKVSEEASDAQILSLVAGQRSLLLSGGEPDTGRAADVMLDDLRSGKLGRVTFEKP